MPNSISKPPWYNHPRFSHMIAPFSAHTPHQKATSNNDSRELFIRASSRFEAEEAFKKLFFKKIGAMINTPADQIDSKAPLADLGLDSLLAVEIRTWLLEYVGIDVPLLGILGHESISSITPRVWDESILLRQERAPKEHSSPDDASDTKGANDTETSILPEKNSVASAVSTTTIGDARTDQNEVEMIFEQMSFAQASTHFMQSLLNDPTMFNVTAQYSITGPLDVDRFCQALSRTLVRHEAYQTRFFVEPLHMQPLQAIACHVTRAHLENIQIAQDEDVQQAFQRIADHEYVLSRGDTFQTALITQSAVSHTFLFGCHHIIMDGVSWHIFLRDLTRSYQMLPLPKPAHSSFDFARRQHDDSASGAFEKSVKYWLHQLDPIPPVLPPLPLARRKRKDFQHRYNTNTAQRTLGREAIHRIMSTSKDHEDTTMQFYLAVVASLFARLLELEEISIGVTDAGRGRFTEVVGHFTNLLPIRLHMNHERPFAGLLHHTSQTVRQGMRHARVPFEHTLEKLGMHRSSRAAPLFQIAFNFRVGELLSAKLADCSMSLERYQDAKTPYDMVFNVTQTDSSHLVEVTSNSDMYSSTTTHWVLDAYLHMVKTLASTPSINIGDCQLYARTQVDNALSLGQGPRVESKWPVTLIERFYQVCDSFPDTLAIKDGGGFLTYGQLSRRVNTLAAAISRAGVTSGDHVAVLCQPSQDTFAAMLGILHVGAIYVPLDITVSSTRQRAMTAVCQPKLAICDVITAEDAKKLCTGQHMMPNLNLSDVPPSADENTPKAFRDYGFLLFTSGSTGIPKGVRITQSGIMNYAAAKAAVLDLGQARVLQQSSTGFDMSLAQAFNAIANAGTLVVVPSDIRGDPVRIAELMLRESIQFTICTPSEYSTLTTYAADTLRQCKNWQYACSGGEVMTDSLLSEFRRLELLDLAVVNCYGPTELSCATTLNPIPLSTKMSFTDVTLTVGKPIPNTSVYISGRDCEPQPVGFPGEICVGGRGVAMGYFGNDADSAKFLHDQLAKYPKASNDFNFVYKTGDKGCLREDGSLILLGRIEGDTIIKLRGLRVDLSEVAYSILSTAKGTLTDAVVTVRGTPEFLVAHVVLAQRHDSSLDSLSTLRSELPLPRYMIPSLILPLDRLPMTTNGKVDRQAVTAMPLPKQAQDRKHQMRLNVSEGELQLIWKEVLGESLGANVIGPETDFFTVGGSSLLLLRLQHSIKEKMGVIIELGDLYQSSTLRNMAAATNLGRSQLVSEPINWNEETSVTQEIFTMIYDEDSSPPKQTKRVVVLTGATGFLGRHILEALITHPDVAKIYCIAVPAEAQYQLPPSSKVLVYHGSLASPNFGLSNGEMATLKSSMDQIMHAGAQGHCLNNYTSVRAANYTSTRTLAELAASRKVPFHFISSPRVVLLSGSHSAPPKSMSAYAPPTDGSEGFMACKWASEIYLENVARMTGLPVSIHRPCSLVGATATHDDALNSVIRYSLLSRTVPNIPHANGFFDFRSVDEVAVEIVSCAPAKAGLAFHHHSSGVKVPFGRLATRMKELYGGKFATADIEEWVEKAAELGLDDLIVSYLRANVVGRGNLDFPYLGEYA
ncbi:acetyl-CoA synthetase-like protein [Byssothecium circinans]|uniref:Acetyl-CoA synthetase-like protein n=1 Tax=Byssothecium circinans TaxID=147558 RepID=A0A6A5T5J8_9PLEO|nr:acetyl-CoA synthetase-like protein [Byssothecium circinans]